jgi:hypothetical protein
MAGVGAPRPVMGELTEEGREGEWEGRGGHDLGAPWGGAAMEELGGCSTVRAAPAHAFCTWEENWKEEGERRKKRKEKNGKNSKLKISKK